MAAGSYPTSLGIGMNLRPLMSSAVYEAEERSISMKRDENRTMAGESHRLGDPSSVDMLL
jgi:hypothetical protein